jgi:hypothetical protein
MAKQPTCGRRWFITCMHALADPAAARVYEQETDSTGCDGEIFCAACDAISQQEGGHQRLMPVLRAVCSNCCRVRFGLTAESEVRH